MVDEYDSVSGTFPSFSESHPTQPNHNHFTFVLFCSVLLVNCQSSTPSPKVRFVVSLVAKATFVYFLCFLIGYSSKIIMFLSSIHQFTNFNSCVYNIILALSVVAFLLHANVIQSVVGRIRSWVPFSCCN